MQEHQARGASKHFLNEDRKAGLSRSSALEIDPRRTVEGPTVDFTAQGFNSTEGVWMCSCTSDCLWICLCKDMSMCV